MTQPLPAEENCYSETAVRHDYPGFFDHGRQRELGSIDGRTIRIFIHTPDDGAENAALADTGLQIIERALPIDERWFGAYPCNNIYVNAFSDDAFATPGFINIGGQNGVNSADILGHEFAHSYFHSSVSYSWFAEGAAQFLPSLNKHQQPAQGIITPRQMYGDFPVFDFTFNDFVSHWLNNWSKQSIEQSGATVNTRICDVDEDYAKGSPLGKLFMQNAYLAIGQENYLRAMATLYKRYRTTNEKNTYYDIFKTIQYFTPENTPRLFLGRCPAEALPLNKKHPPDALPEHVRTDRPTSAVAPAFWPRARRTPRRSSAATGRRPLSTARPARHRRLPVRARARSARTLRHVRSCRRGR